MIEMNLLKALSIRDNFDNYLRLINTKTLSPQGLLILKDYQQYFETRPKHSSVDFNDFNSFFFIEKHPTLDEKSVELYKKVLNDLDNASIDSQECKQILASFEQQEFYANLHSLLDSNTNIETIQNQVDQFSNRLKTITDKADSVNDDMDLTQALVYTDRSTGLKWRLECLQTHFNGGLIQGDFGIIAGYVDSGKTSFLASEVSYMAQQLKDDQYIAWLNTEGNWQQIIPRVYCAALNCTAADLRQYTSQAEAKYLKLMGGNKNRIRILNFQGKTTQDVEKLIEKNPPSLIVFDLLDAIIGFERYMGKEGNATERYGQLYQWAREVATKHCPVLAISQLNGDGNNEPYPSITNLRGSRVDKQAAATFQLILGGSEGNSTDRYLSMPKNKVSSVKGWRAPVKFDPLRSRFTG